MMISIVSIQILQYEFLGPIPLSEWGPPMGDLVYLVMSRDKDRFNILYVGDCSYTNDKAFFIQHKQFKCWVEKAGTDSALHLAVLPLKDNPKQRQLIQRRILSTYRPLCNPAIDALEKKPSYRVRKILDSDDEYTDSTTDKIDSLSDTDDSIDDVSDKNNNHDHFENDDSSNNNDHDNNNDNNDNDNDDDVHHNADNNNKTTSSTASKTVTKDDLASSAPNVIACPCCGSYMNLANKVGENSVLYRCTDCGMSETRLL